MKRNKQKTLARRRAAKENRMKTPGQRSRYARKKEYLHKTQLWGWEVPEPKPWK